MKYLLDTHTLLWALGAPESLPDSVRAILEDPSSSLLISIATPWELAIKTHLGKIDAKAVLDQFEQLSGYDLLETRTSQVIRAGFLPDVHRDPFDRLLAAQAIELRLTLLSRDAIFDRYGVKRIWN
ncbi:MAG TPA: type II toxin-antitoxin system VapC family toxin [Terracidiphilus sp.]|jgi:PIN domain nuclease of toxin-antitoxin system|nr:type II toxin-antitoxin system VapC family toxin [Terracidiphilus sp.]